MRLVDKSLKPVPSEEISFSLPEIEKFSLSNGLEVFFIRKTKLPILQFNLLVKAGSFLDPENKKGLSNLFSLTVDEGAGKYSALELSDEFDLLGSNFSVYSSEDNVYFSLQTLTENLDRSLELFSAVIKSPHFNDTDFNREQRKVITHILQQQDEPDEIADMIYDHIIFGKSNPYSSPTIGYDEDIKNISVNDVKSFYSDYILPNNSKLVVVGNISKTELIEILEHSLDGWKAKDNLFNISFPIAVNEKNIFLFDKKDSVQSEIRIGHTAPKRNENDFFAKTILNNILGGQFSSRINLNLRENKGYTYGANSRFTYLKESAYFQATTSVSGENTGNAVKELMNELEGIKTGITVEEVDFAKSSLIRKFPSNFETYKQIASNLISMVIHSLPEDYFNTYIENIIAIDKVHINNAAIKYIHPDKAIVVIVGDKDKIMNQLELLSNSGIIEVNKKGTRIN
jgi:zinc protease